VAVEGETRRLEGLRQRSHQQLGRMYGHLESVLEEVRLGIGGAQDGEEEANPDLAEATLPTAAATKSARAFRVTAGHPAAGGDRRGAT
jgi:hypothetical protein